MSGALASANRTLRLAPAEQRGLERQFTQLTAPADIGAVRDRVFCADMLGIARFLPESCVDLLFLDPPYNLNKRFNTLSFRAADMDDYAALLTRWIEAVRHVLKPSASIYICGDWRSAAAIQKIAQQF